MSFDSDLSAFAQKLESRRKAVFINTASAVKDSIVNGSPITGAPGQPVDTGTLKNSWILAFDSPDTATVSTNIEYAPVIEDNVRGAVLRSTVGGFHSVRLTVGGFTRLVDAEVAKVTA